MGAEERGGDADRALLTEAPGRAQHAQFALTIQAVAGFHLDRGDALGGEMIEPLERAPDEFILARRAGRPHRRENAAAGPSDLLVPRPLEAQFEFLGAVAAEEQRGLAIAEAGREP